MTDPIVIIGAGQAGAHTAAALREAGYSGPVELVGDEAELPYERPPLSKGILTGHMLASDLQENIAPQLHGSFHGAPLYVVQGCDQGNGNQCAALLESFTKEMKKLDAGPVIPIRPENAARAIGNWIRTGRATS